ncbi:MAG TPA: conjugal transfer protein [Candidatus Enterenecus stercoripullorum]|nr:conjugal transfer protein [Candidatus Enterenecus stercoripullorum]
MCPACGRQKVLRLRPGTQAKDLPVYCKRCGQESIVNIDQSLSQRRDPTSA